MASHSYFSSRPVHLLTSENFSLDTTPQGKHFFKLNMKGIVMVLYFSVRCESCMGPDGFVEIFKQLPALLPRYPPNYINPAFQFGWVNVNQNIDMIRQTKQTLLPIEYVPYIIIYIDGRPMKYTGELTLESLVQCMADVTQYVFRSQSRYKNMGNQQTRIKDNQGIPEYVFGVPKQSSKKKVCYLEFCNAYVERAGPK